MTAKKVDRLEKQDGTVVYRIRVEEPPDQRLDRFLAEQLSLSRSHTAALIEAGRVHIGEHVPKKSYIPEPGDIIIVAVPPPPPIAAEAEDIPLEILYEDDGFLVVNKPAGMVVHPAPGHRRGTLVNALLHRVGQLSTVGGAHRPGIVHRLDKDTSGLVIVAKDEKVHRKLADALARRKIRRHYLAACWGHLPDDSLLIEADIGRHRRDRKKMAVVPGARPAATEIQRLERWRAADFLRIRLHSGRTHQIRVHLHHIGHPIVGDRQYGAAWERGLGGAGDRWPRDFVRQVTRQFLHAAELALEHPITGASLQFSAPLPEALEEAAEWARQTS